MGRRFFHSTEVRSNSKVMLEQLHFRHQHNSHHNLYKRSPGQMVLQNYHRDEIMGYLKYY